MHRLLGFYWYDNLLPLVLLFAPFSVSQAERCSGDRELNSTMMRDGCEQSIVRSTREDFVSTTKVRLDDTRTSRATRRDAPRPLSASLHRHHAHLTAQRRLSDRKFEPYARMVWFGKADNIMCLPARKSHRTCFFDFRDVARDKLYKEEDEGTSIHLHVEHKTQSR